VDRGGPRVPDRRAGARRRILSIVGTRPEAIKMVPVAEALAKSRGVAHAVLLTGQHQGLAPHFSEVIGELPCDDRARTPAKLRERLHRLIAPELKRLAPDLVLVHGDTSSALAGALAARECGVPVGHVEAGLRSFDISRPWPEEGNRIAIDALSDLLFAPTHWAARNLAQEYRVHGQVWVTGNTGIDAVLREAARMPAPAGAREPGRALVLVTCHRKENQGAPAEAVCRAVRRIARSLYVEVAFVLHPNRLIREAIAPSLAGEANVTLLEPLAYPDMVRLVSRAALILTDSGGLQEEGPALGKPVLVLRDVTERPEALTSEAIQLVGTDADAIFAAVAALLGDPERLARLSLPSFPFGDGQAAPRIAAAIARWFEARAGGPFMLRPGAGAPAAVRARPALPPDAR
jgi:UDP-N-acetylglucosamine 2-epimerase (non-hydrolysing)